MAVIMKSHILNRLTEEEFFLFCQEQRDLRIERTAQGEIIVMPPTGGESGIYNGELPRQLANWNVASKSGVTMDSSTGFKLPNGATRSPDVAWVSAEKWRSLPPELRKKFPPVCPEFVMKLRSETDALAQIQSKMEEYMANGALLGWLIDPHDEKVYVYRADGRRDEIQGFDRHLSGEDVLPGFELDLRALRLSE